MTGPSLRRRLAQAAALAGAVAPFAGSPYLAESAALDVVRLAGAVEREDDHVTAAELSAWLRDRKPGLRVIDLRSADEFDAGHIAGAERMSLTSLARAAFRPDETVVLYSEGGAHAAQAWVFLQARGHERAFFLRGGLHEWIEDGGPAAPTPGDAKKPAPSPDGAAARARRRGC
jgi:rhodanese-related sulfurtransferase